VDYEALGRRIRQQRKLLDLTQGELAQRINVSTSYVGHIERGMKHCTLDTFVTLCSALNVTPDMLLQDSLPANLTDHDSALSPESRSMLYDIANVLREYDRK